jgi:hypothetical protein
MPPTDALKVLAVLAVAIVGFLLYKLRKFKGAAAGAEPASKYQPANKGVSKSFGETLSPPWWLQGKRWDTSLVYGFLKESGIRELSANFYNSVYADEDVPWFRDMFRRRATLEQSIERQTNFFIQVWGGPHIYTDSNESHCLRYIVADHGKYKAREYIVNPSL